MKYTQHQNIWSHSNSLASFANSLQFKFICYILHHFIFTRRGSLTRRIVLVSSYIIVCICTVKLSIAGEKSARYLNWTRVYSDIYSCRPGSWTEPEFTVTYCPVDPVLELNRSIQWHIVLSARYLNWTEFTVTYSPVGPVLELNRSLQWHIVLSARYLN